jgi:hypothetical protein
MGFLLATLFAVVVGLYLSNPAYIQDQMIGFYLDQSQPCIQETLTKENQIQRTKHSNCEPSEFSSLLSDEPKLREFILKIVTRDFPEYRYSTDWEEIGDTRLRMNLNNTQWRPLDKVVWLCSQPVKQHVTVSTRLLAICAATPNDAGDGYDGAIKIYEFRPTLFGMLGRRIYEESAISKKGKGKSALFSVKFGMHRGQLFAEIVKHHLQFKREVRATTDVWAYEDQQFKQVFEFESSLTDFKSPLCKANLPDECPFAHRFFDFSFLDLINGGTVCSFEVYYSKDTDGEPDGCIPYLFDAKNWTLTKQAQQPTGEEF